MIESYDGGYTWTDSKFVIDPHSESLPCARRTIVGQLWTDPLGRLWFFYDQSMTYYYGSATNWYSICENPDSDNPATDEEVFPNLHVRKHAKVAFAPSFPK